MPTVTIAFRGRFAVAAFTDFIEHRARRLDLALRLTHADPKLFTAVVSGEPDLIDMFEMACSLGPLDCLVDDVMRFTGVPE